MTIFWDERAVKIGGIWLHSLHRNEEENLRIEPLLRFEHKIWEEEWKSYKSFPISFLIIETTECVYSKHRTLL